MNDNEFEKWDVITFIGSSERWVVYDISRTHYHTRPEVQNPDWPIDKTPYAKGFCHKFAVKVGKYVSETKEVVDDD